MRLKRHHYAIAAACLATTGAAGYAAHRYSADHPTPSTSCDETLWSHVYNPQRLQIVDRCLTVTGTIEAIRKEADADLHILLKVDPPYVNLINSENTARQQGDLVIEPVCVNNPPTQADAQSACASYTNHVRIPNVGDHVTVTGSHVLDQQHGGWGEIHPVSQLSVG